MNRRALAVFVILPMSLGVIALGFALFEYVRVNEIRWGWIALGVLLLAGSFERYRGVKNWR